MIFTMFLFLSMAGSAAESAATGRAMLSARSNDSMEATTTNQETVIQWVQITVVPFGVFLLGACTWGIIQNTAASWGNSFSEFGGGPSAAENQVFAENYLISNVRSVRDVEEGLQLPHRRMDADARDEALNSPTDAREGMQPEFNDVPNDEETPSVCTNMQTPL